MTTRFRRVLTTGVVNPGGHRRLAGVPMTAQAVPVVQAASPVLGCTDEPVEKRPYAAPPFRHEGN